MAVSYVSAEYNPQDRIRLINGLTKIVSVAGVNPVDTTPVELKNVRGHVLVTLSATDNPLGTQASFIINGGYGEWPDDPTWNWYVTTDSIKWCTIVMTVQNTFEITTIAPLVARVYTMIFNPRIPYAPTIQLLSGTLLGASDLLVGLEKINRQSPNYKVQKP